jgi:hypothetical protein
MILKRILKKYDTETRPGLKLFRIMCTGGPEMQEIFEQLSTYQLSMETPVLYTP